jgi:lipoprotein NlpI
MDTLTQAIQHQPAFVLALNARGVLRVLTDDWDGALRDFYQAIQRAPKFADAQANLGTYWILREAPDGALNAFNQVLTINPEFALAYNGRGAAYFGQGEFELAAQDFRRLHGLAPC